jgi:hypothetical protein
MDSVAGMSTRHREVALARVRETTEAIAGLERTRDREIARAVHHGASWSQLGDALGVTAQSAHRRFRWLRYDPVSGQAWQEKPLPLR